MKIAVVGLGKTGGQLAKKLLAAGGFEVVGYDIDPAIMTAMQVAGMDMASSKQNVIEKFTGDAPIIWMTVPSSAVEEEVTSWQALLGRNSILIDGSDSDYRLSQTRAAKLQPQNVRYVDIGTSGSDSSGFSLTVGGPREAYDILLPVLAALAEPSGAYHYFGVSGCGHFIKMVHNAIEYGFMESLAEGYQLLKEGPIQQLDLAKISEVWQHGSAVESRLNELSHQTLSENPNLDYINDNNSDSGNPKWMLELTQQLNLPASVIQAALNARIAAQNGQTNFGMKLVASLRNKVGGQNSSPK